MTDQTPTEAPVPDPLLALQAAYTTPSGAVLAEIGTERNVQLARGYTTDHDDEHGLNHLLTQARDRTKLSDTHTRDDLVEAAACLVAAIEWMDRVAPSAYPDGMEPSA